MRPILKLNSIIDPLDLLTGQSFMHKEIPALFGEEFNPGNWNVGHVVLKNKKFHVFLVTLNKQGKARVSLSRPLDKFSNISLAESKFHNFFE